MRRRFSPATEPDGGVIAVVVALCSLLLFGFAAVAVDLSYDYGTRRQQQNAADSGALAGAQKLNSIVFGGQSPVAPTAAQAQAINDAALAAATANSGQNAYFVCGLIYATTNPATAPSCTDSTAYISGTYGPAVGVRVTSGRLAKSLLGGALGVSSLTAQARAAARVAPLKEANGPFLICATSNKQQSPIAQTGPTGIAYKSGDDLPPILTSVAPPTVNPLAIGLTYRIHGPSIDDCGQQGNSDKGIVDESAGPFAIPGPVANRTGDKAGPTRTTFANTCSNADTVGCIVVVPLCDSAVDHTHLYCVALAAFKITQTGANTHDAVLLGASLVTSGVAGTGVPGFAQDRIVQLIE